MPSPCDPVPVAPVLPSDDDFGRPLTGCGLAGPREFAAYLGPPSYGVPKITSTPSYPNALGPSVIARTSHHA